MNWPKFKNSWDFCQEECNQHSIAWALRSIFLKFLRHSSDENFIIFPRNSVKSPKVQRHRVSYPNFKPQIASSKPGKTGPSPSRLIIVCLQAFDIGRGIVAIFCAFHLFFIIAFDHSLYFDFSFRTFTFHFLCANTV